MLKTLFFSTFTFLCVILSGNSTGAPDYYSTALEKFNRGEFYIASIDFERAIFYGEDYSETAVYRYYKSLCYKELGETRRAMDVLNEINLFNLPDTLVFMVRYEQAYCNYIENEPNKAIWIIDEIKSGSYDQEKILDVTPLYILCLNAARKWEEAFVQMNWFMENTDITDSLKTEYRNEISCLYKKRNVPKYHSPKKAENLSRFIPGTGQIYCGAAGEGVFNFLMNSAILGFSVYQLYYRYYFTAYVVGLSFISKTYQGGMHRAKNLAIEKNEIEMKEFNRLAGSLLISIMKSNVSRQKVSLR